MNSREQELDRTLSALADPTRRAILTRLLAGQARISELAAQFPISLNSVSKHVRVLERAGLVRRTISGREHRLDFQPGPLAAAVGWIEGLRSTDWAKPAVPAPAADGLDVRLDGHG